MSIPRVCAGRHLLTDDNFYISSKGRKRCRQCSAEASRRWRSKNREHMRKYLKEYRRKKRLKKK